MLLVGDGADNAITISRNAAGAILVNNGAIAIGGGTPTVANTSLVVVIGGGGNDTLAFNEDDGALPAGELFGGAGNDTLTGGAESDRLFGQAGNDNVQAAAGSTACSVGAGSTRSPAETPTTRCSPRAATTAWSGTPATTPTSTRAATKPTPSRSSAAAAPSSSRPTTARVRFDRLNPAPFSIDIGTSETLVLNANGGDDRFSATGNLAALIAITVDGGANNDTINGSNGVDTLIGGDGDDFVDGNQGTTTRPCSAPTSDTLQWDPGDGDIVEVQAGTDTMVFNGSNINENMDASAIGGRVRFFRNVAAVTMDTDDVERLDVRLRGGADTLVVNDLSGTDVTDVLVDLTT